MAEAATAQTLSLRGAVRVAARALGYTPQQMNTLPKGVPSRFKDRGEAYTSVSGWREALREPSMRDHPLQESGRYELLLDLSWRLAGKLHQPGTHNGGMVFGTKAFGTKAFGTKTLGTEDLHLSETVPLEPSGMEGLLRVQADKDDLEVLGLPKLDLLGLKTHTALKKAGELVSRKLGRTVDPLSPPPEDRETYRLIRTGKNVGIFQVESPGFTLTEGDMLRRAMTKARGPGAMDGIREEFITRARQRGVAEEKAREIFSWIEGFSVYGFPKAHAASFASISYASAYMRTHHPAEFFCGILNSQPMGFFSPRTILNEARRVGVEILPPDLHHSEEDFTVEEDGASLRVGLAYCKGLSSKEISSILSERNKSPFSSVADIYQRTSVEKDSLVNLIRGGYLDGLQRRSGDRDSLIRDTRHLPKKRRHDSQPEIPVHPSSWWFTRESRPTNVEYLPQTATETEKRERKVLGLNIHQHPLSPYRRALADLGIVSTDYVQRLPHGTNAKTAGLLECLQRPPTKSGAVVHFLLVEDESGLLQATIFENVYRKYGHALHQSGAFLLSGRVEHDPRRGFSYLVQSIHNLNEYLYDSDAISVHTAASSGVFLGAIADCEYT